MNTPKPAPPSTAAISADRRLTETSSMTTAAIMPRPPQSMWAMCRWAPPRVGYSVTASMKRTTRNGRHRGHQERFEQAARV